MDRRKYADVQAFWFRRLHPESKTAGRGGESIEEGKALLYALPQAISGWLSQTGQQVRWTFHLLAIVLLCASS